MGKVKNILIIDDSESTRRFVRTILEDLSEEIVVHEATTGLEALKVLPKEDFALIVTDINMPDVNGLELINFVKKTDAFKSIPIIIISTERSEEDVKRGLSLGADAYITKPFRPEDITEKVKNILGL
ncbi:MAG: response regulator [Nitrospirae bacterium]|nr:MAG: response regulator [Nitrospirota bacterium]